MSEDHTPVIGLAEGVLRLARGWVSQARQALLAYGPAQAGGPSPRPPAQSDRGRILPSDQGPVRVGSVDHVEWYIGNTTHTTYWLQQLGFTPVARQGPDTGVQDLESVLLAAGDIRLLLSTGLTPNQDATKAVAARGDAVHDVALSLYDVEAAYARILHSGLEPDHLPVDLYGSDEHKVMSLVPVTTKDDVLHTLLSRTDGVPSDGPTFAPGFGPVESDGSAKDNGLTRISAVTTVVTPGRLDAVTQQYCALFRLREVSRTSRDDATVSVLADPDSFEHSKVPILNAGAVRFVFVSPGRRRARSHLDDFLFSHGGSGVRTLTFGTADLDQTINAWQRVGIRFLEDSDGQIVASTSHKGARARRAATAPVQARTPLVLALEEAPDGLHDPAQLAVREEAGLAAHRHAHPALAPLGTWGGGR